MPWLCESLLNMQLTILLQFLSINLATQIFVWNSMCISMFKWISITRVNLCGLFFNLQRMFWISFKLHCLPWVKFPLQWSLFAFLPFKHTSKRIIMFELWFHLLSLCWLDHKLYSLRKRTLLLQLCMPSLSYKLYRKWHNRDVHNKCKCNFNLIMTKPNNSSFPFYNRDVYLIHHCSWRKM